MPRRARSFQKRTPQPDPQFSNVRYAKFINYLMERGKKTVAQKIFYAAIDEVAHKTKGKEEFEGKEPLDIFNAALKNVSPLIEVKGRRIGGSNYQVPMEVMEPRRSSLGMKWMIKAARSRKGAPMHRKLALEVLDAYNKLGAAFKKREDTHKQADANKAFAHFARFTNKRK